ncbi:hypothetical protein HMPREF9554_00624 [Treponema phagedenis F0421]|nr:hypothetical protein HMPREF9554_00624 [Treponema phagedenis F0421]
MRRVGIFLKRIEKTCLRSIKIYINSMIATAIRGQGTAATCSCVSLDTQNFQLVQAFKKVYTYSH